MVPTVDGKPACPGSSFHICAYDYDQDGDLDLIVGAQSYFEQKQKKLTATEEKRFADLSKEIEDNQKQIQEVMKSIEDPSDYEELQNNPEFRKLSEAMSELFQESQRIKPSPRPANHVWLFRNKSAGEKTYTSAKSQ